jgi:mRNA interferase MazF
MVKVNYVPDRGDIIWIEFNPQAGQEQAGRRPALVISPKSYNGITGLCVLFPITNQIKGYPFEVEIPKSKITGVILCDHIKNLDWKARNAEFAAKVPRNIVEEVINLFSTLIS